MPHHVYLYKKVVLFRAFCGASIITRMRVLTSANCLLTNQKHIKPAGGLRSVHIVAGVLETVIAMPNHTAQQWRKIRRLYSQEFYRHPQYNLAILEIDQRWIYNSVVNEIAYASRNYNFDGVCQGVAVKTTKSWARFKQLYLTELKMMTTHDCSNTFMTTTRLFFCTAYDYNFVMYTIIPGGGLICLMTGDPLEVDTTKGILVGVTVQNQFRLPTLHQRVGMFYQWVSDSGRRRCFSLRCFCMIIVLDALF